MQIGGEAQHLIRYCASIKISNMGFYILLQVCMSMHKLNVVCASYHLHKLMPDTVCVMNLSLSNLNLNGFSE